jgi:deazaflavin-dependent oxidoreductase (nitroreductase family)
VQRVSDNEMSDYNARVIEEFRANGGHVEGFGSRLVLLHHIGAKSGQERITPLACLLDGDRWVIFGSKAGAPTHPAWYHNLRAHPDVTIEVGTGTGTETVEVRASEATGAERDRLFEAQVRAIPQFGEYARRTDRVIPVITLTRRG